MNSIVRGTTPTIRFTYNNVQVSDFVAAYLTISQKDEVLIEKDISNSYINSEKNYIEWKLSQEETLLLESGDRYNVEVQCRFKLSDKIAGASRIYSMSAIDILKDGVI